MKKRDWLVVVVAVMAVGGTALAVSKGGTLYVTSRNARLQKDSSPTSSVLQLLQPGQEVVWQGADAANKQWHKVTVGGKSGVVFQANLSPNKPSSEMVAAHEAGKPIDPQAFASTGAATKAVSEAGLKYAEGKKMTIEPQQVLVIEALSAQVTPAEVAAHAKKAGIFAAVAEGGAK